MCVRHAVSHLPLCEDRAIRQICLGQQARFAAKQIHPLNFASAGLSIDAFQVVPAIWRHTNGGSGAL
jgi:hypothetical protein